MHRCFEPRRRLVSLPLLGSARRTPGRPRRRHRSSEEFDKDLKWPLTPEKTWDFFWQDPQRVTGYFASSVTLEDYEMRVDGTPRYRMVQRLGPLPSISWVSEYEVFDRPHRHVNRTLESALSGTFHGTYASTADGTEVTWRWDIAPRNPLIRLMLPVLRPVFTWSLQRDLNAWTKAAVDQLA